MSEKILVTSAPMARAAGEKVNILQPAFDILAAAGVEPVYLIKGAKEYRPADFAAAMPGVRAVIAGGEVWAEEQFAVCPDLQIVARYGVGYDAVDLAAAKRRGVMVTNTRVPELSYAVAELAVALTLDVCRNLSLAHGDLRQGVWKGYPGRQIRGKTVGIVGFGAIGKCYAEAMGGLKARLLACDPAMDAAAAKKLGVEPVSMDALLAASDIVSLHAPNTPENRHLFNAAVFAKMKPGSVFINTARGVMVDEKALLAALVSGKVAAAGLDVWEAEPTGADNPLLKLDNVVGVAHVAGITDESGIAMAVRTAQQVVDVLAGRKPVDLLNP